MKAATILVIAFILFCILQWQITTEQVRNRKADCALVTLPNGTIVKADDYTYYTCLTQE